MTSLNLVGFNDDQVAAIAYALAAHKERLLDFNFDNSFLDMYDELERTFWEEYRMRMITIDIFLDRNRAPDEEALFQEGG